MLLTRDQVRNLDRRAIEDYGIPAVVLMENAGRGVADVLTSLGVPGPVLICAGKGNNGADGLVAARHLSNRGCDVKILLFADIADLSAEAGLHWQIVQRMAIPAEVQSGTLAEGYLAAEFSKTAWIVDALFGTGLTGSLRSPFDRVATLINASRKKVLAVDIPSGLDADTGLPAGGGASGIAVRACDTVTFVAAKAGFVNPAAGAWLGKVHVVDIGAPACLVTDGAS